MKIIAFLIWAGMTLSIAAADDTSEGKMYAYKQEIGEMGKIEVHFPKDHATE